MNHFLTTLGIGILSFLSTNADNLLILIILFSSRTYSVTQVVLGQYIGILFLIAISWISSYLSARLLPDIFVHLLGVFPIILGVYQLLKSKKQGDLIFPQNAQLTRTSSECSKIATVVMIVISAGGDNVAIYTPLFASSAQSLTLSLIFIYLILTGIWCALGYLLVSRNRFRDTIRTYANLTYPYFLIGLGLFLLMKIFI